MKGICHRCTKEIELKEEQIKFMIDNKLILPAWVCDECVEKDEKECWACDGTGVKVRRKKTFPCHVCLGKGELKPNHQEIKKLFNKLWDISFYNPKYKETDWKELQRLLRNENILV